jgi:hypothetical protein
MLKMRKFGSSLALALIATFSLAATASADTWYASPTGSGIDCTELAPCEAHYAVEEKPEAGDTVVFAGGDYNISYFLEVNQDVSVEGAKTGTPTRLIGSAGAYTTLWVTAGTGTGHHVTDLTISNSENGGNGLFVGDYTANGVVVDRVHATSTGPNGPGIRIQRSAAGSPTIVRNSVGRATGDGGRGIWAEGPMFSPGTVELYNVVGDATGLNGYGISLTGGGMMPMMCGNLNAVLKNSIARSTTDVLDLHVAAGVGSTPCLAHVDSTNSVWRDATTVNGATITTVGGLPNMVPLFVDAAAGDFHPVAGSPVVNAGANDAKAGLLDLDRNARVSGSAIDVGPYETFEAAPPVVVPPATPADLLPSISGLKFSPTAFLPKPLETPSAAVAAGKKPKGSTVRFNASEAATVSFVVEAKVSGRKKGKSCSRTATRGKKCSTFKAVKGGFSIAPKAGANTFNFTGYLRSKPLKAGTYRLIGTPSNAAGNTGKAVKAAFKILRR